MSRPNRYAPGGLPFHVLDRAVGRRKVFESTADYEAFVETVAETLRTRRMRICGYCIMPNHWYMILWPEHDGDLSAFVQHLTNLHVKRWKRAHAEIGLGHLYQGRFKSFPIQLEDYFHRVVRYVERNPLRANLVCRAEEWQWSSLGRVWDRHRRPARFRCQRGPCGGRLAGSEICGSNGSTSRKPKANSRACENARIVGGPMETRCG